MKRDSRLSGALHVLLHMAEEAGPVTSEVLAKAMGTNAVVIRRTMACSNASFSAEALLLARLGEVTLEQLSSDFHDRLVAHGGRQDLEHAHAS